MIQNTCNNCGHQFSGKYCNLCGEKVYADADKSMRHFLNETVHFFTHLDSKFVKTLLLIFRKPAYLSLSYCNGVRGRYYKPVSLFFIGVILYLLFPFLPGLNLPFDSNIINFKAQGMGFMEELAYNKAASNNITIRQLSDKYDSVSSNFAKVLLLMILPFTGLVLKMLFFRKKKYFHDHFILATEASSITLYLIFFILPLILFISRQVFKLFNASSVAITGDLITMNAIGILLICWSTIAFRRFYNSSFLQAILKGFLFLLLHYIVIYIIYRLILFLTILLFI